MTILAIIIAGLVLLLGFTAFTGAPYVPSVKSEIKKAFTKLYPLGKDDVLIDLGAGDGKVLKEASLCGAKAIGIELNPVFFLVAKFRTRKDKNIKVIHRNFFSHQFPKETTVIYLFGDSRDIARIYDKIKSEAKRLNKTLYVISNGFEFRWEKPEKRIGAYFLYKIR